MSSLKVTSLVREESLLANVVFEANQEEAEQWKNSSGLKKNFSILHNILKGSVRGCTNSSSP